MRRYFIPILLLLSSLFFLPQPILAGSCSCTLTTNIDGITSQAPGNCVANKTEIECQNSSAFSSTAFSYSDCHYCSGNNCEAGCANSGLIQINKPCSKNEDCQVSPCQNGHALCQQGSCFVDKNLKQCWDNTNAGFGQTIEFKPPTLEIKIPGVTFPTDKLQVDSQGYITVPYLVDYIKAIYKFLVIAASVVAAIVIILNGFRITMSAGGEEKGEGIKRVGQAVIGLFIMWSSYAILYTVNPALTQLQPIRVKYITPTVDDLSFEEDQTTGGDPGTDEGETTQVPPPPGVKQLNPTELDDLFKSYGDCLDEDWVALRELAKVESNLNPTVHNAGFFTGLFQTKTKYANPFLATVGKNFGNPADFEENKSGKIVNPLLLDPENNTIVGTLMYLNTDRIIKKYCDKNSMTPEDYFYFIYVGHQSGPAALNYDLGKMKSDNGGQCSSANSPKYIEQYYTNHAMGRSAAGIAAESEKTGKKYVKQIVSDFGGGKLDWKTIQTPGDPNFVCPL